MLFYEYFLPFLYKFEISLQIADVEHTQLRLLRVGVGDLEMEPALMPMRVGVDPQVQVVLVLPSLHCQLHVPTLYLAVKCESTLQWGLG